jgi:hypothetical protein
MNKVIVYVNEKGGVNVTYPTPEFLENNTIKDVLAKDCPDHAIIIDASEMPQGEDDKFFDAWELVNGKVLVNQTKKQAIIDAKQFAESSKQATIDKLSSLGLNPQDLKNLLGA